jgi:5'-nucleotidase
MRRCLPFIVAVCLAIVPAHGERSAFAAPRQVSPRPAAGDTDRTNSGTVDVQLLAFNDFHGTLLPRTGSNGRIAETDAGGVEFLAGQLKQLRDSNPNTIVVSAGDNVGASPLLSAMFHDEPTVEALGAAGLQVSAVGNHELDEGWAELVRLQQGGCHPTDGCQDGTPFTGAAYQYLAANILLDPRLADATALRRLGITGDRRRHVLPAASVKTIDGVKIGFIGLTLRGAPQIVSPEGIRGLIFQDEAIAANTEARRLRQLGVRTIVVLIHEGGTPRGGDVNGCDGFSGPIIDIAKQMSDTIDVVVSGHTHEAYNCRIGNKLVTSAASYSRVLTDIDLTIDRRTGRVVNKTARNLVVGHDQVKASEESALIAHYEPFARTLGGKVVGSITAPLVREPNAAGESGLGDVIADAMFDAARTRVAGGVAVAFWNAGGIRSDLIGTTGSAPGRVLSYEQVFDTLPFGNQLVIRTMTGEALLRVLEQQFDNPDSGRMKMLQVSSSMTYAYDESRPAGRRIDPASVMIAGRLLVPGAPYRIAASDFVWAGGDGFSAAMVATDPLVIGVDVDILLEHLKTHSPLSPGPQDRIRRRSE